MPVKRKPEPRPPARRYSDASLAAILAANVDGIVVVDRDGVVCFANPAAEQLFGRPAAELVGSVFGFPLVAGETTELDVVRGPGDTRVVEMRVVEIEWEGERAFLASLRDTTERRRAEAERADLIREQAARKEAEAALRARDDFLAATAHELKTPLTRLRLYVQHARRQVARAGGGAPDSVNQALQRIDLESEHISRLISDLIDLSRIESGAVVLRRSVVDLRRLITPVVTRARGMAGEDGLQLRMPSTPVMASVDPKLVEQVLTSAVANALRSSPPDAGVEIELAIAPQSASQPGAGQVARVVVHDHGMAVPPEDPPRLFGRSFQVHSNAYVSGLGLWLYLGRQLAELHGGSIEVEFPDGGGRRVVVSLPLV